MTGQTSTTVLVVDDDETFVSRLCSTLNESGYKVLSASDARQAYAILDQQTVDLAIVDLDLPDKSGLELIHTATTGGKHLKILATTGVLSDLHLEIATYMGAHLAIRKFPGVLGGAFPKSEWIKTIATVIAEPAKSGNARN